MTNRKRKMAGLAMIAGGLTATFVALYAAKSRAAEPEKPPTLSATCVAEVELALAKNDSARLQTLFVPGETAQHVGEMFKVSGDLDQLRRVRGILDGDGQSTHRQLALRVKEHDSAYLATWFAAESSKLGPVRIQVGYVPTDACRLMGVWMNFDVKQLAAATKTSS